MLEIGGKVFDISKDGLNLEGIVELFKGWT